MQSNFKAALCRLKNTSQGALCSEAEVKLPKKSMVYYDTTTGQLDQ